MSEMKPYMVITPEFGSYQVRLEDGSGSIEIGCDLVWTHARNKREAKLNAVRFWRQPGHCARYLCDDPQCNPFGGLRVEPCTEDDVQQEMANGYYAPPKQGEVEK